MSHNLSLTPRLSVLWQALVQAHDSVAEQESAEGHVTQYLGETVKVVRLEKTCDTPLVRLRLSVCRPFKLL